jgi:catechol 2,3-dioxygenase-like lactoylglutathione lyase family enzyme
MSIFGMAAVWQTGDMKFYRGRMIDHVQLVVDDLDAAARFYAAVFEVLGIPLTIKGDDYFCYDELFVCTPTSDGAIGQLTGRVHLAFQAKDRAMVDRFHAAAIKAGGVDNGPPGERKYHPGYYGAFVVDPAGNNIEAVYHGKAKVSAPAIEIEADLGGGAG